MAFRQNLGKFFSNHAETNENHPDASLQTRYYKTTKDKALNVLEAFFNKNESFRINAISKERGEISASIVKGRKAFIVGTVIMVRPHQTAIDFSVTTESAFPFDLGYSTKVIQQLYNQADKELPVIPKTNR
ncbi:cytosolic protein [Virgibacillus siamensis]|uniref:cytosolic protein n=1 Tax=Virgibacillus siamensis TaxID=480071 RepID=UPI0009858F67|nr:cytosolic protein [Virgibacillus siamensis]